MRNSATLLSLNSAHQVTKTPTLQTTPVLVLFIATLFLNGCGGSGEFASNGSGPTANSVATNPSSATATIVTGLPAGANNATGLATIETITMTTDPTAPVPSTVPPAGSAVKQAGAWSNPETWGGKVPVDGAVVRIPEGKIVTLDSATANLAGLQIDGTLQADNKDVAITSHWIAVKGILAVGSSNAPFTNKATITLLGTNKLENLQAIPGIGIGTKMVGVLPGGKLNLFGEQRMSWSKLNGTLAPGATQMTLIDDARTWRAGDRLVIAPSGFEPEEAETVVVTSVNGKVINFTPALKYEHFGRTQTYEGKLVDMRSAVGLLSRNIVVQGGPDSDAIQFGGHMLVMEGGSAQVEGISLLKMGQKGLRGRYPIHWHLAKDRASDFIKNSAVVDSFQRAVVMHGTNNVLVEGNVSYNVTNHAFVWGEDGNETGNQFIRNLGVLTKSPDEKDFVFLINNNLFGNSGQSEFRSATFWGRGFSNTLQGNIAAGSINGFGYFFDRFSPDTVGDINTGTLVFKDNIAHSAYREGARGVASEIYPEATFGHGLMVTAGLGTKEYVFENYTGYKNYGGAWLEDRAARLKNSVIADVGVGVYIHRGVIDNVTIIGQTDNKNGIAPVAGGFGTGQTGAIHIPSSHGGARAPVIVSATVVNWADMPIDGRGRAAVVWDTHDVGATTQVGNIKMVNVAQKLKKSEVPIYEYGGDEYAIDDPLGVFSITGSTPTRWVQRRSPLVGSGCNFDPSKNLFGCNRADSLQVRLVSQPISGAERNVWSFDADGKALQWGQPWYFDASLWDWQSTNFTWLRNGSSQEIFWPSGSAGTPKMELWLYESDSKQVDLTLTANSVASLQLNGASVAAQTSLNALKSSSVATYFYDNTAKKLYLRLVGGQGIQKYSINAAIQPNSNVGREPNSLPGSISGLSYQVYSGQTNGPRMSIPTSAPLKSGNISDIDLSVANGLPAYTIVFRGYLNVLADGRYALGAATSGSSDVYIGNSWILGENQAGMFRPADTGAYPNERAWIALKRGLHPITIVFSNTKAGQVPGLSIRLSSPAQADDPGFSQSARLGPNLVRLAQ